MASQPQAQIILSFSRDAGIVAVAHGEEYRWAQTALKLSGFQRQAVGTYILAASNPEATRDGLAGLLRTAEQHRTAVTTSSRPFLGDIAHDLTSQLGEQWAVELEVCSHPVWQEDLVPWLWDAGELSHAVQTARVPYAARLSDGEGISLLLIERPGHDQGYVLGAFAPEPFDDNYEEPHAPLSVIIPGATKCGVRIVLDEFLPAYQRAWHTRRLDSVTTALDRIREAGQALQTVKAGWSSDGMRLDSRLIPHLEGAFTERVWQEFQDVLTHAPALLERCASVAALQPGDAAVLARLDDALVQSRAAFAEWKPRMFEEEEPMPGPLHIPPARLAEAPGEGRRQLDSQVTPAIETWVADGAAFVRLARGATPGGQPALPAPDGRGPALPPSSHGSGSANSPHRPGH